MANMIIKHFSPRSKALYQPIVAVRPAVLTRRLADAIMHAMMEMILSTLITFSVMYGTAELPMIILTPALARKSIRMDRTKLMKGM